VIVQDTGLLDKLRAVKAIVMEPRASEKENFDDIMRQFYDIIKNSSANGVVVFLFPLHFYFPFLHTVFAVLLLLQVAKSSARQTECSCH